MHPSDIHIVWHDSMSGRVVNASDRALLKVRVLLEGDARIRARRNWSEDHASLRPGGHVGFTRLELRGPAVLRVRWKLGVEKDAPWLWVDLPLHPPLKSSDDLLADPWSLGARTRE